MAKMGENLASWTTSSVFERFSWNLAQMFALGCRCARCIFRPWQKVRYHYMVTTYYGKKFGENWRFCYFYFFKAFRVKFCPHVGHEVMCEIHSFNFFDNGGKCITMVTAYQGKKMGKTLRIELLPHFTLFRHLKWNLAHMVAVWCSCAKHTFWQWRKVCCHGNGILCQKLRGKCISNQIWHTCSRWSLAVHDTFWDCGGMCIAMVTAYYSKNWKTTHFTSNSNEIGFTWWPWGVDVQETFLRMGKNVLPW